MKISLEEQVKKDIGDFNKELIELLAKHFLAIGSEAYIGEGGVILSRLIVKTIRTEKK